MAATGVGNGLLQAGISLGSVFNALASGADAITAAIALPYQTNATAGTVWIADLELLLSASVTTGAGSPFLQGTWLNNNGNGYDGFYGVVSSQLFPINYTSFTYPMPAATATGTVIRVPGIVLPYVAATTASPEFVLFNNLGVALPATVTATIYPAGGDTG